MTEVEKAREKAREVLKEILASAGTLAARCRCLLNELDTVVNIDTIENYADEIIGHLEDDLEHIEVYF